MTGPQTHRIPRGHRQSLTLDLPQQAGALELLCLPTFQPGGPDQRHLGCMLESAAILNGETAGDDGSVRELPREVHAG